MEHVLDWSVPYLKHFEEMTRIPHGSFNEKPYSDYLVEFAKSHGFVYKQYEIGNVIIYKAASAGYEDHPPVMLQAHMDMVCEKTPGNPHDFTKDPLQIYVKDGFIRAKDTTLGADDGIGVAYMLAILEANDLAHPPLECVFTVQEEVGSMGAEALKFEDITSRTMIGLDDGGGTTTYVSGAGGIQIDLDCPLEYEATEKAGYKLTVQGLQGGHSGPCISEERGNANKLVVRVLHHLRKICDLQLVSLTGGAKGNAIPLHAEAVFVTSGDETELQACVEHSRNQIRRELEFSDAGVQVVLERCQTSGRAMTRQETNRLINFFYILPNGFRHKSMKIEGLTVASENLGVIRTENERLHTNSHLRGALESYIDEQIEEYRVLAQQFAFSMKTHGRYPAWDYVDSSPLRELLYRTYRDVTGGQLTPIAVHGGLEGGFFKRTFPDMDMITVGPYTPGMHTVEEALDLKSTADIYEVIVNMLAQL